MDKKGEVFLEVDPDLRRISSDEAAFRPLCPYGYKCYRKNASHLKEYRHSPKQETIKQNSANTPKTEGKMPFFSKNAKMTITNYFKPRENTKTALNDSKEAEKKEITASPNVISSNDTNQTNSDNNLSQEAEHSSSNKERVESARIKRKFQDADNAAKKVGKFNDSNKNENLSFIDAPNSSSCQTNCQIKSNIKNLSAKEWNDVIKEIFLVQMPQDFFLFWDFCKKLLPKDPQGAFLETLGFKLVGPFDILSCKLDDSSIDGDLVLTHWRYFYDPPEFQTFAILDSTSSHSFDTTFCYHLGYFRDTPEEINPVVVSNDSEKSCQIDGVADNIFAAMNIELAKRKRSSKSNKSHLEKVKNLEDRLASFAAQHDIDLNANVNLKKRKKQINAPTFHKFGIVVNVVDDIGYRELPETDEALKKLFKRIINLDNDEQRRKCASMTEIQRIMTLINYANDEMDFGMALEFGLDLFCTGHQFFHKSAKHLLSQAYNFLERDAFGRIIVAHLENRRKGYQLSVL